MLNAYLSDLRVVSHLILKIIPRAEHYYCSPRCAQEETKAKR